MSQPEAIYVQLAALLEHRKGQIYDIEILPSGFSPPFLHDGRCIGITKALLARAFLLARHRFFDYLQTEQTSSSQAVRDLVASEAQGETTKLDDHEPLVNTELILLFDPEHLTACNWRKRRLLRVVEESQDQLETTLKTEVALTTSLLRSPLHRHTKSPTLWQHRLWIVSQLLLLRPASFGLLRSILCHENTQDPADSWAGDDVERIVISEISVVLRSGELHPMNYYAFTYMRKFLGLLGRERRNPGGSDSQSCIEGLATCPPDSDFSAIQLLATQRVVDRMHTWCLAHPGDTSGWSFLTFLLERMSDNAIQAALVRKTVEYAVSLAWDGEPLWRFVDICIARFEISLDSDGLLPTNPSVSGPRWRAWARWAKASKDSSPYIRGTGVD
jgi:hypothetical protein